MNPILIATLLVSVIGLIIGIVLVYVGRKFAVEIDEKEVAVRECLPGNNCGGCGYAGCDALAAAIVKGEAPVTGCPVGGAPVAEKIGHIMDVEAEGMVKTAAFVKCSGDSEKSIHLANYIGIEDCQAAADSGLGTKSCPYGCLGLGSCVKACPYDAIHIVNGIAKVNRARCMSCSKCVAVCPRHLIEIIPDDAVYAVSCSNPERGPAVKKVCEAGCIGCKMCERQCEFDAIHVTDNVAKIDYSKCTRCGKCAEKCPTKAIAVRF